MVPGLQWSFVCGLESPADCRTRVLTLSSFMNCKLWFDGPAWLKDSTVPLNKVDEDQLLKDEIFKEEKKPAKANMLQTTLSLPSSCTDILYGSN